MQATGRILQIFGLVLLPLSMFFELSDVLGRKFGVSDMLVMLIFGTVAFYLGRMLEGYSHG